MSLYNMLHGFDNMTPVLLKTLGVTDEDFPRYRDIYADQGRIVVLTRTGGGNRSEYEFFVNEHSIGPNNHTIRKIPGFIEDHDDEFDCTFALWYFKVPEDAPEDLKKIINNAKAKTLREKTNDAVAAIKASKL